MGIRLKKFDMKVRKDNTQQFVDVGLLGSDVDGDIQEIREDLNNKAGWFVTPQMFGAKGDGMTDDTNAFKSMLADTTNTIYIPKKSYKCSLLLFLFIKILDSKK